MSSTSRGLTLLLLMSSVVIGCASNQPVAQQIDDSVITAKVESKLAADPEINPFNIDVDVQEGIVRLSGVVEKKTARGEAAELARRTVGVRGVINDIEIGERSLGSRFDDSALTARVKSKLVADPEINPFNIDVDTLDGIVTLSGRVADGRRRQEAEELARNTKGVLGVRNRLEVGSNDS